MAFLDPCRREAIQGTNANTVTIYCPALQNVPAEGRGQGPAGDRDRGAQAAGWLGGHLPCRMVPPG